MTIINVTATITVIMTLAAIDPPTIVPIEVDPVLVLVYTSVHSGPVVPVVGNTRFLPTLTCIGTYNEIV